MVEEMTLFESILNGIFNENYRQFRPVKFHFDFSKELRKSEKAVLFIRFPSRGQIESEKVHKYVDKTGQTSFGIWDRSFRGLIQHFRLSWSEVKYLTGKIFKTFKWTIRIFHKNISKKYFKYFKRSIDRCEFNCSNFYVILQTLWVGPSNRVERP